MNKKVTVVGAGNVGATLAQRLATEAGRRAWLAGRMPRREVAVPSSPVRGMLQ